MDGLTPYVREQIASGRAILFLGAGASIPAQSRTGTKGMSGNALRDRLCDKFLGGEGKTRPLNFVADRSTSVAGMGPVHRFLKELFGELQPTAGHLKIPLFKWKGIATTNYDFLVEKSFEQTPKASQLLERIVWDRDDFDISTRNSKAVTLLKLHGCLTRLNDPELPLVISSHDYYKFKANRALLINTLREWGTSYPIVFCGYGIADENIKEILFDLTDQRLARPQYVLVDPGLEPGEVSYWKSLRFDCIKASFDDFMNQLAQDVQVNEITLAAAIPDTATSVTKLIPSQTKPSDALAKYLDGELQHIHGTLPSKPVHPSDFYRGNSEGFGWVTEFFDVRRRVSDTLIEDSILNTGRAALNRPFVYVLKGYAGAGKTVCVKRFAVEASTDYEAAVFFLGQGTVLRVPEICELARLVQLRIYLVLDDILLHAKELSLLFHECKRQELKITVVGAARTNEWNIGTDELKIPIESEYELLDLNQKEVEQLIAKLEKTNCLGFLEHLEPKSRVEYFLDKLKSQLLVALHEATEGKNFEEIIEDEYLRILPSEARLLYLDVCTLDRFDVGLRAGLMARLSGISFEDFSGTLLKPLERIISVNFDYRLNDYVYRSRHHHIAEIVFTSALRTPVDKSTQIIRILRLLNGAYESDRLAVKSIVRGRALAEQFSDKAYASQIFEAALECGVHAGVVDHQRAVFELHHNSGDIRKALDYITKVEQNPGTLARKTIAHTKSNILRRLATNGKTQLERDRFRQDALVILNSLTRTPRDALPFLTRGQLLLEQLEERFSQGGEEASDDVVIAGMVKEIEENLRRGLQLFPEDGALLNFEASLSTFLNNTPRALKALERAYAANKGIVFPTIRLARHYLTDSKTIQKALEILRKLIIQQPLSKDAHFELARALAVDGEVKNSIEIGQHLKRSFSPGDSNIEARFSFARHEFLYGNMENSKREFSALSSSGLSPYDLNQVRKEIRGADGKPALFDARLMSKHESFGFINSSQFSQNIFMHYSSVESSSLWEELVPGNRLRVTLGFSYKGPRVKKLIALL